MQLDLLANLSFNQRTLAILPIPLDNFTLSQILQLLLYIFCSQSFSEFIL